MKQTHRIWVLTENAYLLFIEMTFLGCSRSQNTANEANGNDKRVKIATPARTLNKTEIEVIPFPTSSCATSWPQFLLHLKFSTYTIIFTYPAPFENSNNASRM